MAGHALQFTGPKTVELRELTVGPPGPDELLIETSYSAISPGTELLVYRNQLPADLPVDESLTNFEGTFSYPVEYGYATVGTVTETGAAVDTEWKGQWVFAFEPHRSLFRAEPSEVIPIPDGIGPEAGTMLATVETAMNLVLDSQPRIGERVAVFGAGVIGLTTIRLLAAFPVSELDVVEPIHSRRELAREFGADRVLTPAEASTELTEMDLAVELSGQPDGLDDAVGVVGFDGRIVVGSWYGNKRAPLDLGSRFHRNRISITSSQVSTLAPELRGRWDNRRRVETAFDWLERLETDRLISHRIPFEEAAHAYELLDTTPAETLQVVLTYDRPHEA